MPQVQTRICALGKLRILCQMVQETHWRWRVWRSQSSRPALTAPEQEGRQRGEMMDPRKRIKPPSMAEARKNGFVPARTKPARDKDGFPAQAPRPVFNQNTLPSESPEIRAYRIASRIGGLVWVICCVLSVATVFSVEIGLATEIVIGGSKLIGGLGFVTFLICGLLAGTKEAKIAAALLFALILLYLGLLLKRG